MEEKRFTNLYAMVDDILLHVGLSSTRGPMVSDDDPMSLDIGFTYQTPGREKHWCIRLSCLKMSFISPQYLSDTWGLPSDGVAFDQNRADLYRSYMQTTAGRNKLAELFAQGIEPTVPFQLEEASASV